LDSLSEQDVLLLLAEISVAILGFAGVMAVIGRPRDAVAKAKGKALVAGAAGITVFSILPMLLAFTEVRIELIWRISSGLVVLWSVLYYLINRRDVPLAMSSRSLQIIVAGDGLALLVLAASAGGYPLFSPSFPYLATLVWFLTHQLVFFVQSMAELWGAASE
jgi:hypothetical protein